MTSPPGARYYAPEFSTVCSLCAAGFHDTDQDPSTPCVDDTGACSVGHYSGAGACDDCPAGTADTDGDPSTVCASCPPGTFAAGGETACTPCAPGTADIDSNPSTECIPCIEGQSAGLNMSCL